MEAPSNDSVLVVGGGPAGAATAIELCRLGVPCTVIDCAADSPYKLGESLSPNAGGVLHGLEVGHLLQDASHLAYTGNVTVWGTEEPLSRYFFAEPFGNGWHLDRLLFESQLKGEATARGTRWLENTQFISISYEGGSPRIFVKDAQGDEKCVQCGFVVDCSGRASVVARKADGRKRVLDNLTAYWFVLDASAPHLHGITFVEAVENGWWYAAPIPQDRVVVNFMSDSDLHKVTKEDLIPWLMRKLSKTMHLRQLIPMAGTAAVKYAGVKTATTSALATPSGERWLAAGDALCSYDPLTSFGIIIAMAGGKQAAGAVSQYLGGDPQSIERYLAMQQDTFNNGLSMLQTQYSLEKRWSDHPFWKRRQ